MKKVYTIVALLAAFYSSAQTSLITDRPNQSDAPFTLNPGELQIESGLAYDNQASETNDNATENLYSWATIWRVGLVNRLELRLITQPGISQQNLNGETAGRRAGMADLQAGLKWNLIRRNKGSAVMALISQAVLPNGSRGFTNESFGVINKLVGSHQLTERHSLNYNLGHEYFGAGDGDLTYTLYWGVALDDRLTLMIENFGRYRELEEWLISADGGLTYLLNNNLQLDYIFGFGINHNMNYHTLGLSVRIGHQESE